MKSFISIASKAGQIDFPEYKGIRIMMMPFYAYDVDGTIPDSIAQYRDPIKKMLAAAPAHCEFWDNTPCYLTIDERHVPKGEIQRNPGLHIDGMFNNMACGAWGGGGSWGSVGNGMLVASNVSNTLDVYIGVIHGYPVGDGDCEHLRDSVDGCIKFSPLAGEVVWADGFCLHEALPMQENGKRQFIRVSLPNSGAWFEDYTPSPFGIMPKGDILPPRIASQEKKYGKVQ